MRSTIACMLVLGLLPALPLAAQASRTGDAPRGPIFLDTVDVSVVNVDVYVTDKKGRRITGLRRQDFEFYVDRKPVAITNFYYVEGEGARTQTGARPGSRVDLDVRRQREPDDQRLYLVIFVDNLNLRPFTRNRALRSVRTFLRDRLRPSDEVMLVTYERALHVRHRFTSDHEIIASALAEVEEMTGMGVRADLERRDILTMISEADSINQIRSRATQYAESLYNDMTFILQALTETVDSLAGLPGRKAILYVSDGLPMKAGEDIFFAIHNRHPETNILMDAFRYDLARNFQNLTIRANAHRVTFYPLDAAGLRTYSYQDASNKRNSAFIDQVHFSNLQTPLQMMAQETGGMALLNTNNLQAGLDRVAGDFDTYYSLGFSPTADDPGRYHRIKVEVKGRQGLRVRAREGYRGKPVSTRMTERTLAALHHGYQPNPMRIEILLGDQQSHPSGRVLVTVKVKIPIGKINFLPQGELQRGRLRLFIAAMDSAGGLSPVQDVPIPIDIPQAEFERARQQFYEYRMDLLMRPGRQALAVGALDEIGATSSFVTRNVSISTPQRRP